MQASMTPSHMACSVRVSTRSGHAVGMILPPPATWSRYSRMTRLSNTGLPSSVTSVGILPSGLSRRSASAGSIGSALTDSTRSHNPRWEMAMRTLRPNGDRGVTRSSTANLHQIAGATFPKFESYRYHQTNYLVLRSRAKHGVSKDGQRRDLVYGRPSRRVQEHAPQ